MPPRNNLAEHIKWLLNEKPFVPPAHSLVACDPDAPISSATVLQSSSSVPEPILNNELEPAPARATRPLPQPALQRCRTIDIHKPPSDQDGESDMARLRATPGSGRPRLVLAGVTPHGTPSGSGSRRRSRDDDGTEHRRQEGGSSKRLNSDAMITPTSERLTSWRKQRVHVHDIEAIDLTADDEDRHPPRSGRLNKAKKRKSDELLEELRKRKSPRPMRAAPAPSPGAENYDDFAHIDDMILPPESPPPPYSTTIQNGGMQALQQPGFDEDLGFRLPSDDEDQYTADVAPQPTPSSRKPNSLSRVPSETSAPPRKAEKQARKASPTKVERIARATPAVKSCSARTATTRRVREAVLDSEDDELDDLSDFDIELESAVKSAKTPPFTMEKTTTKKSSQGFINRVQSQTQLPIRSPSKPRDLPGQQPKQGSMPTPTKSQSPRRKQTSPKKEIFTPASTQLQSRPIPSSSEMSKDRKEAIRKAVARFSNSEGSHLQRRLDVATANWSKAKEDFLKHLEVGTTGDASMVRHARSQKEALEQLIALVSKCRGLGAEKQLLRKKIDDDLDTDVYNPADGVELNAIAKSLEDAQVQIYYLLESAGMSKYLKSDATEEDEEIMNEVVIKSTQATPAPKHSKHLEHPGSHHLPQNQYVKQTQISVHEVWTPSQQIKFAEQRPMASPPPQMNLTTRASDNAKSAKGRKPNRISETPPRRSPAPRPEPDATRESTGLETFHTPDEEFGSEFGDGDNLFMDNMGPEPVHVDLGLDENDFCDDEDVFSEGSGTENHAPEVFDWKGDKAGNRSLQPARQVFQETSVNRIQQSRPNPSPKKPLMNNPGMSFQWSRDVRDAMLERFGLRGFRPGQLEAINATLNAENCFVLMPTGGGKSLCYQLPSVINSGKTRGVTIVVSPLLSLMEDQVSACRDRFKMQAFLINGESTAEEKDHIMDGFGKSEPGAFIQLLYVTPEMLSKNQRMIAAFQQLHRRNRLARIVIDEAHCVSQWGHDFRPDYKALGEVLGQFQGVPIIALTATATQLVRTDVMANLGIRGCRLFSQSFNRPNLSYEVRRKEKGIVQHMASLIKERYSKKSGIIYCLSRKSCESVAQKLMEMGIRAYHYHAGMESAERSDVQRKWQSNEYHVIVATIAFGMGIDKADVRFVIHHTLPKSLEGYYQETGRAGRDGMRSECYLYYQYADCKTLKKMIEEGDGSREQKQRQHDMLRVVIQFCENKSDCRRVQVLNYFNEPFKVENCKGTCDNCTSGATFEEQDLTEYAAAAISMVKKVEKSSVTLLQCTDAFRGTKNSKLKCLGLEEFGFGKDLDRECVERIFSHLLEARVLREESKSNKSGWTTNYVKIGVGSSDYEQGRRKFKLQVRVTPRKPRLQEQTKKATKKRAEYPSTNVSSPTQPPRKRNLKQFAYSEDDDEDNYYEEAPHPMRSKNRSGYEDGGFVVDDDDDFAPIRIAKPLRPTKDKRLGAPITVDERIANLTDFQRDVLDGFMNGAKQRLRDIKAKKGIRSQPFSDTVLREMCLDLPKDQDELLSIPGIIPEMVETYGKMILEQINIARSAFGQNAPDPKRQLAIQNAPIRWEDAEEEDDDDDDDDQRPLDPNHQNVIDLCSEAEGEQEPDNESAYSAAEEAYEDDGAVHVSHFFQQLDPRVEEFNSRYSQIEAEKPNPRPKAPTASRAGSKAPTFKKKGGGYRRKGSGSFSKGYAGVTKRSKTPAARKSGSIGGTRKATGGGTRRPGGGSGGGGGGWGGVMAMPT